jgi:hypothetical protein
MTRQRKSKFASKIMAGATGLEPATFGVTGRRSNQLSYAPVVGSAAGLNVDPVQVKVRSRDPSRVCEPWPDPRARQRLPEDPKLAHMAPGRPGARILENARRAGRFEASAAPHCEKPAFFSNNSGTTPKKPAFFARKSWSDPIRIV